ncbi:hypothetical protein A7Q09_02820 [Methylacidiphilum sp. Yel]|uniref:hypothetical protein n=1 Tax=Methylacidiphilum sp. Yel TaxID=1847730 RepID=UPI00106C3099|nr:hypothetical protein [Methylacidiphilum sp. Yel]TFE65520.1 hypothetical protein A7Q09_02820 [Methylacidiphilum sp. Yel]
MKKKQMIVVIFEILLLLMYGWSFANSQHKDQQTNKSSITLEEIVSRAISQNELMTKAMLGLEYQEKIELQKLDPFGKPVKTDCLEFLVKPGEGFLLSADPNSGTLSFRKMSTKDIQKAQTANLVSDYLSLRNLVPRFKLHYEGMNQWHGLASYIIGFEPKPNQPYQSKIEKLINSVQGKIWISKDDFSVLYVEGRLPKPVAMAWFIAVVDKLDIHYQANAEKGLFGYMPSLFDLEYRLKYIFGQTHARQIISMKDFKLPRQIGSN